MGLHVESAAFRSEEVCIVLNCGQQQDVLMVEGLYFITVTAKLNKFQIYDIKGTVQRGDMKVPVCLISGALMIFNLGIHTVNFVSPWELLSLKN